MGTDWETKAAREHTSAQALRERMAGAVNKSALNACLWHALAHLIEDCANGASHPLLLKFPKGVVRGVV